MVERGAVAEVLALATLGLDPGLPAMKAVGVPPLIRFVAGEIPFEEARRRVQRDTRRFARRQTTWFGNQMAPTLSLSAQYSESFAESTFAVASRRAPCQLGAFVVS